MMLARLALAAVLALVLPAAAGAQESLRIAAVVNDEAISFLDLEARVKLILISSNVGYTPENRRRAAPQVLRQLVDERLQIQEGKRLNLDATEEEIKEAFRRIEEQAKLPPGGLDEEIKQAGINRDSMVEQMRASIVWQKVIRQRVASQVQVGDDEVEEILSNIKRTKDQPELRIAEILLGVDRPEREAEVRRFAEQLADQARGGADFNALARQFSEAASAATGGEIGWVLPDQLDDIIAGEIRAASPGTIVGPIRTTAGFHIIRYAERRLLQAGGASDSLVNLRQAIFPISGGAEEDIRRKATELRSAATCPDFEKQAEEAKAVPPYSLGRLKVTDLNAALRPAVAPLAPNKVSEPIKVGDAIAVFMVCDRADGPSNLPSAADVREQLFRGKLSIVARRYLRDLRRAAYLDFRT
jgi:peptidyl-prolyl cis-trans isomerase SurA